MSRLACTKCNGTGRFVAASGRDVGECWRCNGAGAPAVVYRVRHASALPLLGAAVAAVIGAMVVGGLLRSPAPAAAAPQIDYAMLANAVKAAMPPTAAPAVAAPAVAPAVKTVVKRKIVTRVVTRPAVFYYVAPRWNGCTCAL
jgi:hypothetical protein